ncbi:hypothetical protein AB0C98_19125 [Streptomyces sp. NPDC048558]|uniref:hypothetical protein n=1 Tax=Streptomyces sp. NPDC048558 TaxID=3155759 RepID=UPI003421667E
MKRELATFTAAQWTEDGRQPTTRADVLAAFAAWRRARRRHWRERAPLGEPPPSAWFEAQQFGEALARFRGAEADRLGDDSA